MKYLYTIVFILSLGLNIFLTFKLLEFRKQNQNVSLKASNESNIVLDIQEFNWMRNNEITNEDNDLDPNIKLVSIENDTILFANLFDEKKKIIFRFSEFNCQACINAEFEVLKNVLDKHPSLDVIILAHYESIRSVIGFYRRNKLTIPIYHLPENKLNLPADELNIPYVFLTDSNLKTQMFFIPNKRMPELSKDYYNIIIQKYFTKY